MTPKTIVFGGEFWFGSVCAGLAQGLRALGHAVIEVDLRHYFPLYQSIPGRVIGRLMAGFATTAYRDEIRKQADINNADFFLTVKGSYVDPDLAKHLRSRGVLTINFYPDFTFAHADLANEFQKLYDFFVTTKPYQVDYLNNLIGAEQVRYIPHGYSPLCHRRRGLGNDADAFDYDVTYVGNASPYKAELLSQLTEGLHGLNLVLAGHGWDAMAKRFPLASWRHIGQANGDVYARLVERSRINLAFHFGPAGPEGWHDSVSTRTFEIPACGGFMLHIDNEEVRDFFVDRREVALFTSPQNAVEQIRYYLDHPSERMEIARQGYERCTPDYGLDAKAAQLMDWIEQRSPSHNPSGLG
jgi:spore maturation protein CgeB